MKFSSGLPLFGNCIDRYVVDGYGDAVNIDQMFKKASQVEGLEGIELVRNWHIDEENINQVKEKLEKYDLEVSLMIPDLWAQAKWSKGSFTSYDEDIREEARKEVKSTIDMAEEVDCNKINLWFGQDGNDYSFQLDYEWAWEQLALGLTDCAEYNSDMDICIEYKLKEPRRHCMVDSAAKTLLLIEKVGKGNIGVLLDIGHGLAAQENVSESIAILNDARKLWHLHFNDNYRYWDDDMMVASVHTIETLEILYWLEKVGYEEWYSLDIFPFREDGVLAAEESIKWIKKLTKVLHEYGEKEINDIIRSGDSTKASAMLREIL